MDARRLPTPPSAVTFDCWSTLIVDKDARAAASARAEALREAAQVAGVSLDARQASAVVEAAWNEHLRQWRLGRLFGPEGAARWCLEHLGIPHDGALAALAEAIASATRAAGTRVVEGAGEAIAAVRSRGIPTALVCDTGFTPGRVARAVLDEHGIVLDRYVFSDEVGFPKPDPRIFLAALEPFGVDPATSVHIGDLRRTDVAGARAAGMASVRFAGVHDDGWIPEEAMAEEADAVLRRWSDLPGLLGLGGEISHSPDIRATGASPGRETKARCSD